MARRQTSDLLRARPKTARRPEHVTEQRSRPPIVEMRRVTKVYPGGHVGLEHVSLRVDRGEFARPPTGVAGP
jgi:ATPase subunit of ABC transporter with duplicated ATPase domains